MKAPTVTIARSESADHRPVSVLAQPEDPCDALRQAAALSALLTRVA